MKIGAEIFSKRHTFNRTFVELKLPGKNGGSCYSQNGDAVTVLMWQS